MFNVAIPSSASTTLLFLFICSESGPIADLWRVSLPVYTPWAGESLVNSYIYTLSRDPFFGVKLTFHSFDVGSCSCSGFPFGFVQDFE